MARRKSRTLLPRRGRDPRGFYELFLEFYLRLPLAPSEQKVGGRAPSTRLPPGSCTFMTKAVIGSDDFVVKDGQDRVVFKIDSHALSLHNKKVLLDHAGHPILCVHKAKLMSAHEKWEASLGEQFNEEAKLFRVQKAKAVQLRTQLEVFLAGNTSDDNPDFTIYLERRQVQILQGDDCAIAEVKRKFSAANVLLDKHTFSVSVWPNVDQAYIMALLVIMDEIQD
ncbi:hypothetical protein GOP47_0020543 [Adiantum capillus-veneris]|uniref:Uncharacterized protein n=1 Tax=Adiantum capillus-veneris TaxID=13818 RepID=A0A9D4UA99_ADICA|nr:hypothetical protein GOP47_0020543 [Adiantum capillus-veneris]